MHRVAEDTSLKVLHRYGDNWRYANEPYEWTPWEEYKIEEPVKPHVHQKLMDEAKADPSLEWVGRPLNSDGKWLDCKNDPMWLPENEYRKKPKTVNMWQWAYVTGGSPRPMQTVSFYPNAEEALFELADTYNWVKVLGALPWTKYSVEIES